MSAIVEFLVLVPFYGLFVLAIVIFLLTRSILRIVREIAPEIERELRIQSGLFLIDDVLWVRPRRFHAFAKSKRPIDDPRLRRRLAQYRLAYRIYVGIWICFASFIFALVVHYFLA